MREHSPTVERDPVAQRQRLVPVVHVGFGPVGVGRVIAPAQLGSGERGYLVGPEAGIERRDGLACEECGFGGSQGVVDDCVDIAEDLVVIGAPDVAAIRLLPVDANGRRLRGRVSTTAAPAFEGCSSPENSPCSERRIGSCWYVTWKKIPNRRGKVKWYRTVASCGLPSGNS